MDPNTLVTPPDVGGGRKVIEALKDKGVPMRSAFWAFFQDAGEWRLVIATHWIVTLGPRETYAEIQKILERHKISVPLRQITVADPSEPLGTVGAQAVKMAEPLATGRQSVVGVLNLLVDARFVYF